MEVYIILSNTDMDTNQAPALLTLKIDLSIILPTYNEAENILNLIDAIKDNLPSSIFAEIIVVDDNSPDGTGTIVTNYIKKNMTRNQHHKSLSQSHEQKNDEHYLNIDEREAGGSCLVKLVNRKDKGGLISAILKGIEFSVGKNILVMDADFSHPPEIIPQLVDELVEDPHCIVVASRYIAGGAIKGWTYKREILSKGAAKLAIHGLKVRNIRDPMSGFFVFPRYMIENIRIDTKGYKLLLEMLVKSNNIRVKEIPYTFTDRKFGESKLDMNVIFDYTRAIWHLYRYGQKSKRTEVYGKEENRKSVLFFSKAGRFSTVGASGLLLNYLISSVLSNGILAKLWYLNATIIGISLSITSNFLLNKAWTFEDKDFSAHHTLKQYGMFVGISSIGAGLQLALVYILVEFSRLEYGISLIIAVAIASASNFLLNKRLTFREKIWG
jgi:dolichol-phosphate mannosyltransferase